MVKFRSKLLVFRSNFDLFVICRSFIKIWLRQIKIIDMGT